ncbi:hypothetical protein ACCC92_10505 [Mucilaginibacter sp. Mucisp84]|uniref:hypothetical protein n=1 Tax=Mucilaginibacter sp. Mucisp84 TaxID=3243058 RepID=UPI0039A72198
MYTKQVSLHKIKRVSPKGNPFFIENKAEICDMALALFLRLTKKQEIPEISVSHQEDYNKL